MRKPFVMLILASSLAGCSWLGVVKDVFMPSSSGLSVDAELTVGDKQEEVNTEVVGNKETTHNTADVLNQTYETVNEAAPWWVVLLLILGWVLPEPTRMGRWIRGKVKGGRNDD